MNKLLYLMIFTIICLYTVNEYSNLKNPSEDNWFLNNPSADEYVSLVNRFTQKVFIAGDFSDLDEILSKDFVWVYWDDGYQGDLSSFINAIVSAHKQHPGWEVRFESMRLYNMGVEACWEGGLLDNRLPAGQNITGKDTLGIACFVIRDSRIEKLTLSTLPNQFKETYKIP